MEEGKISLFQMGVYTTIHLQADYKTGIWNGSASRIARSTPRDADLKAIQRALEHLDKIGFIKRFHKQGTRGGYPVLLDKYEPRQGGLKGLRLNARKTKDYRHPIYEPRTDADSLRTDRGLIADCGDTSQTIESKDNNSTQKRSRGLIADCPRTVRGPKEVKEEEVRINKEEKRGGVASSVEGYTAANPPPRPPQPALPSATIFEPTLDTFTKETLDDLGLSQWLKAAVRDSIQREAKWKSITLEQSANFIRRESFDAQAAGRLIDEFWFKESKFRSWRSNNGKINKAEQRKLDNLEVNERVKKRIRRRLNEEAEGAAAS
jgi:hypothetical protein